MAEVASTEAKDYLTNRLGQATQQEDTLFTIPIIDIGPSYSSSAASRAEVAKQIYTACTSSGFFYITSHSIPSRTCSVIISHSKNFFHTLPLSAKSALHLQNSTYGYGWEPANATSINGNDEQKEAFNWGYEAGLDLEAPVGKKHVQLDGSLTESVNQWPKEEDLSGFRDGVKEYYAQALQLARHLCRLFALSLHLPEDYFDAMVTDPSANGRLMYYPARKTESKVEDIGLGAHSDYQCFTILLCDSTPGLEILSPSGKWVQAPAVEGALIVNIGDMMMRWTNGLYKSTVHRVVNCGAEERLSVPLFFGVNNDQLVETLPSCISNANPEKYGPIKAGEYILKRLAATRL